MSSEEITEEGTARKASIVKIRASLMGRPMRTFSFNKDVITIGRDPEADVFLDNPGVSRHHLRLVSTPEGLLAEDLGSANGTFLNDKPLERAALANNDILRVGKFSLWICFEEERRETPRERPQGVNANVGTTVLSTTELEKMMSKMKDLEPRAEVPPPEQLAPQAASASLAAPARSRTETMRWSSIVIASLFGAVLGSCVTWLLSH